MRERISGTVGSVEGDDLRNADPPDADQANAGSEPSPKAAKVVAEMRARVREIFGNGNAASIVLPAVHSPYRDCAIHPLSMPHLNDNNSEDAKMDQRIIRLRDAPKYCGMDRNRFNAEVRSHLTEIPIGKQGVGFDRL